VSGSYASGSSVHCTRLFGSYVSGLYVRGIGIHSAATRLMVPSGSWPVLLDSQSLLELLPSDSRCALWAGVSIDALGFER